MEEIEAANVQQFNGGNGDDDDVFRRLPTNILPQRQ